MQSVDVVFKDRYGLHPRSAMRIQTTAAAYRSAITIQPLEGGSPLDARSMLSLVSSGIRLGDRLRVAADGPDETDALSAVADLIAAGVCHP
jgi:phosphotransferase system HPr (HPr) family protein